MEDALRVVEGFWPGHGLPRGEGRRFRPAEAPSAEARESLGECFEREALPEMKVLYATAYRMTGSPTEAEDLVQETYLRAFRSFGSYTPRSNIRAWLFKILHRARTDSFRKAGRSPKTVELVDVEPAVPPAQDALAGGQEDIARAIAGLPGRLRSAVVLRDLEEFTYEEIAEILGVPIGTVMSRIHRGRALLRPALQQFAPLDALPRRGLPL